MIYGRIDSQGNPTLVSNINNGGIHYGYSFTESLTPETILLAGSTTSPSIGGTDLLLIEIKQTGQILRTLAFGDSQN